MLEICILDESLTEALEIEGAEKVGNRVKFEIKAENPSKARAKINSLLREITMLLKIGEVIK